MPAATDDKILEGIAKTGFVLEHKVVTALQEAGWLTINGSFYVDDVSEQARELDVIAYKIARFDNVHVITGALISCKKDATNTAAFMSRDRSRRDPNADWEPVHYTSRLQPLKAHLASSDWKDRFYKDIAKPVKNLLIASRDIFAFQMIGQDGKIHNDKPYYDSVTGLLKALDHEVSKRRESKSVGKRIYQLSLHTVMDAPMVDVQFTNSEQQVRQIDRITCFSRFMVKKKDTSASVHFLNKAHIDAWIKDLNALHEHNGRFFSSEIQKSYAAILSSKEVQAYFLEKLDFWLKYDINAAIGRLRLGRQVEKIYLSADEGKLQIEIDKDEGIESLNEDNQLKAEISKILKRHAKFEGPFEITDVGIPF